MATALLTSETPLFIVFNAASGSGDKQKNLADMRQILGAAKRTCEVFLVESPQQIAAMAQRAAEAAVKHEGAVIAAGGDGTINVVAAATLKTGRPLGIVPQGTFNYSCRAHGIPLETIAATQALLTARVKPVQAGMVNDHIFLVNASVGLYPQLLEDREEYKHQYGRKRAVALWAGVMTLLRYRSQLSLEIDHDQMRELVRTPTLFVGNNSLQLEQVGLPEAEAIQQHRLAAVIVKPVSNIELLWLAIRGALGQLGEADKVHSFPFVRMTVMPTRRTTRRGIKVATDGETCWMSAPLKFTVAPRSLMLMVPVDAPHIVHSQ